MNITISHPAKESFKTIASAIATGQEIKRSPHVGNVNYSELATILGIASLGGVLQVELVDTIQGNDRYSQPNIIKSDPDTKITLTSRKKSNGYIVGSCRIRSDAALAIKKSGLAVDAYEGQTLTDLHRESLQSILPENVCTRLSSEYFAQLESGVTASALNCASDLLQRSLRRVDSTGKISTHEGRVLPHDIFGVGESPETGVLPPLEVMMAIEFALQAAANPGADAQILHVGGPDMIVYTKREETMNPTAIIAHKICSELGLPQNASLEYTVPDMVQILANEALPRTVQPTLVSQYDLKKVCQ